MQDATRNMKYARLVNMQIVLYWKNLKYHATDRMNGLNVKVTQIRIARKTITVIAIFLAVAVRFIVTFLYIYF